MSVLYRFLPAACLLLCACDIDQPPAYGEVNDGVHRRMSFNTAPIPQPANPTSCVSLPDSATIDQMLATISRPDQPAPQYLTATDLVAQPGLVTDLEASLPRDGYAWQCFSAYPSSTEFLQGSHGSIHFTFAGLDELPARILSTLHQDTRAYHLAILDLVAETPSTGVWHPHSVLNDISDLRLDESAFYMAQLGERMIQADTHRLVSIKLDPTGPIEISQTDTYTRYLGMPVVGRALLAVPGVLNSGASQIFYTSDGLAWHSRELDLNADLELFYASASDQWWAAYNGNNGIHLLKLSSEPGELMAVSATSPPLPVSMAGITQDSTGAPLVAAWTLDGKLGLWGLTENQDWVQISSLLDDTLALNNQPIQLITEQNRLYLVLPWDNIALETDQRSPGDGLAVSTRTPPEILSLAREGDIAGYTDGQNLFYSSDAGATWTQADLDSEPLLAGALRIDFDRSSTFIVGHLVLMRLNIDIQNSGSESLLVAVDTLSGEVSVTGGRTDGWSFYTADGEQLYRIGTNKVDNTIIAQVLHASPETTPGGSKRSSTGGSLGLGLLALMLMVGWRRR